MSITANRTRNDDVDTFVGGDLLDTEHDWARLPTRYETVATIVPASVCVAGVDGSYRDPKQLRQAAMSMIQAAAELEAANARY